jgi:hypothetical protein
MWIAGELESAGIMYILAEFTSSSLHCLSAAAMRGAVPLCLRARRLKLYNRSVGIAHGPERLSTRAILDHPCLDKLPREFKRTFHFAQAFEMALDPGVVGEHRDMFKSFSYFTCVQ